MLADSTVWLNHFEYHAQHSRRVPEDVPDALSGKERVLIAKSIATFQLGEYSRGRTLLCAVRRFAQRHGAPELIRIMELFVREERRHADLLREFMTDHLLPVRNIVPTDLAFRAIRRLAGFELYLYVLVTAELIGNVFYRALERATGCQRLKILCRTLVADELAHIGFESQLLSELRLRRSPLARTLIRSAHRALFTSAVLTVWLTNRAVLRTVGYDASTFLRVCREQFSFYLDLPRLAKGKVEPTPS
jgi:tRNA isopentenyl-2-thiomethyl-A-37 hydroxylase MiaE